MENYPYLFSLKAYQAEKCCHILHLIYLQKILTMNEFTKYMVIYYLVIKCLQKHHKNNEAIELQ